MSIIKNVNSVVNLLETKNRWARDDPAFILIQIALMILLGILYGLLLDGSMSKVFWKMFRFVFIDFLLVAFVVAFFTWFVNRLLKVSLK